MSWASRRTPHYPQYNQDDIIKKADEAIFRYCRERTTKEQPWDGCIGVGLAKESDVNYLQPVQRSNAGLSTSGFEPADRSNADAPPSNARRSMPSRGDDDSLHPAQSAIRNAERALQAASSDPRLRSGSIASWSDDDGDQHGAGAPVPDYLQDPELASKYADMLLAASAKHHSPALQSDPFPSLEQQAQHSAALSGVPQWLESVSRVPRSQQGEASALLHMLGEEVALDRRHQTARFARDFDTRFNAIKGGGGATAQSSAPSAPPGSRAGAESQQPETGASGQRGESSGGPRASRGSQSTVAAAPGAGGAGAAGEVADWGARIAEVKGGPEAVDGEQFQARFEALRDVMSAPAARGHQEQARRPGGDDVDDLLQQLQLGNRLEGRRAASGRGGVREDVLSRSEASESQVEELLPHVCESAGSSEDGASDDGAETTSPPSSAASSSFSGDQGSVSSAESLDMPSAPSHKAVMAPSLKPAAASTAPPDPPSAAPSPNPGAPSSSPAPPTPALPAASAPAQAAADAALSKARDLEKKAAWVLAKSAGDPKRAPFLSAICAAAYKLAAECLQGQLVDAAEVSVNTALSACDPASETAARVNVLALAIQRCKLRQLQRARADATVPWEEQIRRKAQLDADAYLASLPSVPKTG